MRGYIFTKHIQSGMSDEVNIRHSNRFTPQEDALLKELVKNKQNKTWKEIAQFLPGRTACQCRDRYNQYLFKDVVSKPWTVDEDRIIIEKYREFGPHWVKISQFLPGRSGNNVKNRWNSALLQYHGIEHNNVKQERRSKREKWETTSDMINAESVMNLIEQQAMNELEKNYEKIQIGSTRID